MTIVEYFVIFLGLLTGYWVVAKFISEDKNKRNHQDAKKTSNQDIDLEFSKVASESWAVTLDISNSASVDEIRKAYKIQMSKYHPDKVATLGVELKELAERKSKEINIAYKRAMKDRNIGEQLW